MAIFDRVRLTFCLKINLEEFIGDCVLDLMVSEVLYQLGEDVGGFISAKELRVLSFSVFKLTSLEHLLFVGVLGLLNIS